MRLYFAGADTHQARRILLDDCNAKQILVSYYLFRRIEELKDEEVFLDSGAYTAWTQHKEIDIKKYINYLKEYKDKFTVYANLDVIGNPEKTLENQKIIEQAGLNPLPVFHSKTDFKYLEYYATHYDYLALGGLVPLTRQPKVLINWLNKCYRYLLPFIQAKGLKIHLFGISDYRILLKYPVYSCDSTSWQSGVRYGTIVKWEKYKMVSAIHWSDRNKFLDNKLSTKLIGDDNEKLRYNIKEFLEMEKDITSLWERRNIKWND